jgi:predicted ester cyclase
VAATGRGVKVRELALYRIEDGRIAEVWGTVDELGVLEQIR